MLAMRFGKLFKLQLATSVDQRGLVSRGLVGVRVLVTIERDSLRTLMFRFIGLRRLTVNNRVAVR